MSEPHSTSSVAELIAHGKVSLDQQDYRTAFALFEQATRMAPDSVEAWINLGHVHELTEDWFAAAEAYGRALALNPQEADVWVRRGDALLTMRHFGEAVRAYDRALALRTHGASAGAGYEQGEGKSSAHQDSYDDSDATLELAALSRALLLTPAMAEYWQWTGDVLQRLGRHKEAIAAYDRALALWPPDPARVDPAFTWERKALALMQLRRYEEVVVACDHALSFDTGDAVVWAIRGAALMRLQRHEEAIASLEHAVAIAPGFARAWKDLVTALRAAGRETDADDVEHRTKDLPDDGTAPMIEVRF